MLDACSGGRELCNNYEQINYKIRKNGQELCIQLLLLYL